METRKRRIALRRYIVPIVFVCCCVFFVSASSAKMVNEGSVVKDGEVSVAGWSVDVSSSNNSNMTLNAGSNAQQYSLVVTNDSDVASTYSIRVSNIPDGVKIGLDIASDADLVVPVDGEVEFTNTGGDLGYVAPNNTRTHVLTLSANATAEATQESVDMAIEVLFAQKDPQL